MTEETPKDDSVNEKTKQVETNQDEEKYLESENVQLLDSIGLTEEQKSEILPVLEMYSGPIPHPEILKQYDDIYQGSAKKIIDNGVEESSHRRRLETVRTVNKTILSFVLLILYFSLTAFFGWLSYKIIISDHVITGGIIGGFSVLMGGGSVAQLLDKFTDKDDVKS